MTRAVTAFIASISGRRRLWGAAAVVVVIWFAFFDSHSLLRRLRWQHQARALQVQNEALANEIERLRSTVAAGLSRADIERLARTEYGMSRPGETVHPVDSPDSN